MINYISQPFKWFFKLEAASGLILLFAAIIALIVSNSNLSNIYLDVDNRSVRFLKNYKALYNIYKKNLNLNYVEILIIFIKLLFTTFNKNIFKFKSLFLKYY